MDVRIRWAIERDLAEMIEIDQESFASPWDEEKYRRVLRQKNTIGMVADLSDVVVGLVIYELLFDRIIVVRMVVAEGYRGCGIGYKMLGKLRSKRYYRNRSKIIFAVDETNLDAQLWLRRQGIRCVSIEEREGETKYVFVDPVMSPTTAEVRR